MSTPMPPNEPLDAQEREFARILRALPGGEPPAALDAKILRAASNAAASSRRPGARLLASAGALWGIGSAAAAVLALGVFWQMKYGAPERAPAAASAPVVQAVSDREDDEAVPVDLGEARADAPAMAPPPLMTKPAEPPAPRAQPGRALERAPVAAAAPPPPPPAPEAYPADQLDEHVARDAAGFAAQADAAGGAAAANAQQRAETREREAGLAAKSAAEAAPAPATAGADSDLSKVGAVGSLSAPRQEAKMKPATWLAEIRRLRDAGKLDEARARLVEFRRAYPTWVVPTDLAPLLRE